MRVVLATFGSRGDVQPMLALSLALKETGHDILLAAPPEKAGWAEQMGCPFTPLGSDVTAFLDGMENAYSLSAAIRFIRFLRIEVVSQFDVFPSIIAGADLVVGSSLVFALSSVAESLGIAYRYIAFTPQILPSGFHPSPVFKHQGLPQCYNRMTWRASEILDGFNMTKLVNEQRSAIGLGPVQGAWQSMMGSRIIVASDRVISEVPQDVTLPYTQTGYMHLHQPDQHLPELEAFLDTGPPPVYAGFGSMPKHDQAKTVPLIVQAARNAGTLAVIAKFWDEPSEFSDAEDVFFIKGYPHLKLFPRMAAVIHHGGAGTTASSAISGVPQIIVPHALDQFYWGNQVFRSNLGPRPLWRSRLTIKRLTTAIQECLTNDLIRQKAQAAADTIRQQDSVEMTVGELLKALD
jgi:UDP:flavonoid glycosyltransferase YjiC (YdhE family)